MNLCKFLLHDRVKQEMCLRDIHSTGAKMKKVTYFEGIVELLVKGQKQIN